jgi:TRAP-type C4-dicarboxylate transport system permease small subunit
MTSTAPFPAEPLVADGSRPPGATLGEASSAAAANELRREMDESLSNFEIEAIRGETLIERIVDGAIGAVGAGVIVTMTALVFGNAVGRYAFNASAIWADELVVALMPWLAMSGLYLSIRQREMIRVDYFAQRFPARVRRVIAVAAQLFSAAAFAYLAAGGLQYVKLFGSDTTLYLDLPTGFFTSALLIGSLLVAVAFLIEARRELSSNGN